MSWYFNLKNKMPRLKWSRLNNSSDSFLKEPKSQKKIGPKAAFVETYFQPVHKVKSGTVQQTGRILNKSLKHR